ncbi:hypothetical protein R1flu_017557 [Riccia fluitans]|uniref:Uncharacterized protein n=1 Tax=Riccia fluitans TaxID=41844 RepID=A0ABD1ZHB3_9MARC
MLEQYVEQNTCDPSLDLGLRCLLGDSSDNVPGLPELAPGFGYVLYRNLQVLKLRRDVDIILKDEWCRPRDRSSEAEAFQILEKNLLRKTVS